MRESVLLGRLRFCVGEHKKDTRNFVLFRWNAKGTPPPPADNVMEALEILRKDRPHLGVTDIGMPDYNGYAFIAAVRKQRSPQKKIPVIALTAYSTPADRDTALISGFDEYLAKPFEPEELLHTIRRLYDEHRVETAA